MSGRADLRAADSDIQAHALHSMILERCRRPLGHDMKNAVQSMYSGIEILAKSVAAGPAARVSPGDCVTLLRQQLDGLQNALGRILDDVAPEQTGPAPFDVCALLKELARFLATDAAVAGVKLRLDLPAPISALARAAVIRRVLLALLLNAIDNLRGGGTLTIAAAAEPGRVNVELRLQREPVHIGRSAGSSAERHRPLDAGYVRTVARDLLAAERAECSFDDALADGAATRVILPGA